MESLGWWLDVGFCVHPAQEELFYLNKQTKKLKHRSLESMWNQS